MNFEAFCNLDPEPKYRAYLQLKAALVRYNACLFWNDQDIELIPGVGRVLARRILYYFASGQIAKTLHPVCHHNECINPFHSYPIEQVEARKTCWAHIRQFSQRRASCILWGGGKISSIPTYHADTSRLSVAQICYELHYGVRFFANPVTNTTCGVPGCINPQHVQLTNPAFVYHWHEPTHTTLAEALLDYVYRLPSDEHTKCRFWTGGMNNGRTPVVKVGTKRYSARSLLYNYAYGPPVWPQKVFMSCGHSTCIEPSHLVSYGLQQTDQRLELPIKRNSASPVANSS